MISKNDVLNVAKLSKLYIDESELEGLINDMDNIVNFANEVSSFDLKSDNIESIEEKNNNLRKDEVVESFDRDLILKNAEGGKNGFFCVKNHK